jgi:hypothetical protein
MSADTQSTSPYQPRFDAPFEPDVQVAALMRDTLGMEADETFRESHRTRYRNLRRVNAMQLKVAVPAVDVDRLMRHIEHQNAEKQRRFGKMPKSPAHQPESPTYEPTSPNYTATKAYGGPAPKTPTQAPKTPPPTAPSYSPPYPKRRRVAAPVVKSGDTRDEAIDVFDSPVLIVLLSP